MKHVFLDFEYYNSNQQDMDVVCVAIGQEDDLGLSTEAIWLHGDPDARAAFVQRVRDLAHEGAVFVAYNAIAEGRALLSLGVDPTAFRWKDLMLEWKQLGNENHKRMYGRLVDKSGKPRVSTPPAVDEMGRVIKKSKDKKLKGTYNQVVGYNLVNCVYNLTGNLISSEHKDKMRDRILAGGPFNAEDRQAILDYCVSDIVYLPEIMQIMEKEIRELSNLTQKEYDTCAYLRGEWAVRLAKIEHEGIPVNLARMQRMADNHAGIREKAIEHLVENFYPFFIHNKKEWHFNEAKFKEFLESKGLVESWPRTDAGKLSRSRDTLEDNEHIQEIKELRRFNELDGQIKSFKKDPKKAEWKAVAGYDASDEETSPSTDGKENIFDRVGSDHRLRCYFNPMGTQTSRNAPPAKNFIFAMSAWIRSCVEPPPGYAITGLDYSSQEVLIAGLVSGDQQLIAAYDSGDVYLHFGKLAGAIPPTGTKDSHREIRDLFKATVLGMQFQIGKRKLHKKLVSDTGNDNLTEEDAFSLYSLHKQTFWQYWAWVDETINKYSLGMPLRTNDGWYLFTDNPNPRSAGNFPIQGGGAAVLRRAVRYAQDKGVRIIATLHDAIYCIHEEGDKESPETLKQCMLQAFQDEFGHAVRVEGKTIKHGDFWIEDKGLTYFRKLAPYFLTTEEQEEYWLRYGYTAKELAKMGVK